MSNKSKKGKMAKPMDPAEAARIAHEKRQRERNPANWGANMPAMKLDTANDIAARIDGNGEVLRARRYDAIELLFLRGSLTVHEHGAARRFQADMAERMMLDGAGAKGPAGGSGSAELVSVRSIDAGKRLDKIATVVGERRMKLAWAISEPQVRRGERVNWRKITEQLTGAYHPVRQLEAFKGAWTSISDAYAALDRGDLEKPLQSRFENGILPSVGGVAPGAARMTA